jgi:hypothetical protein
MSIAYIRLSRVLLKIRKNTHRYRKLLLVPVWTISLLTVHWGLIARWEFNGYRCPYEVHVAFPFTFTNLRRYAHHRRRVNVHA